MGAEGLTAGQVVDIKSENKEVGLETLEVRSGWWERVMQEWGGGGGLTGCGKVWVVLEGDAGVGGWGGANGLWLWL